MKDSVKGHALWEEIQMASNDLVRKSTASGSFYPADPDALRNQIDGFMDNAELMGIRNIKAIISPHAGYVYSGQIAAYSFKQVAGIKYDSVIIIAPSHAEYFDYSSIYRGDAYETPLGPVKIDKERATALAESSPRIQQSAYGHRDEHSLEVQLPFLQVIFGKDMSIVPVVIGNQSRENIEELGSIAGELFSDDNVLIIASTDLSHYHPYDTASKLDERVSGLIGSFDTGGLMEEFTSDKAEMCGGGPVLAAMTISAAMGADSSKIIKYANSGDISGDRSAVVGYLSAAFYKK
jgi:AmmeMemoRadiSam system protein B